MYLTYQLILVTFLFGQIFCQQSSVQIQKIEADPPNPNVGEGLKIRCFLINVDPFAQYPTQVLWSIRRFSKKKFFHRSNSLIINCFIFKVKIVIFVY
jgi:hypothetical protein